MFLKDIVEASSDYPLIAKYWRYIGVPMNIVESDEVIRFITLSGKMVEVPVTDWNHVNGTELSGTYIPDTKLWARVSVLTGLDAGCVPIALDIGHIRDQIYAVMAFVVDSNDYWQLYHVAANYGSYNRQEDTHTAFGFTFTLPKSKRRKKKLTISDTVLLETLPVTQLYIWGAYKNWLHKCIGTALIDGAKACGFTPLANALITEGLTRVKPDEGWKSIHAQMNRMYANSAHYRDCDCDVNPALLKYVNPAHLLYWWDEHVYGNMPVANGAIYLRPEQLREVLETYRLLCVAKDYTLANAIWHWLRYSADDVWWETEGYNLNPYYDLVKFSLLGQVLTMPVPLISPTLIVHFAKILRTEYREREVREDEEKVSAYQIWWAKKQLIDKYATQLIYYSDNMLPQQKVALLAEIWRF